MPDVEYISVVKVVELISVVKVVEHISVVKGDRCPGCVVSGL